MKMHETETQGGIIVLGIIHSELNSCALTKNFSPFHAKWKDLHRYALSETRIHAAASLD